MNDKLDLFIVLKQNLPLLLLGGLVVYLATRNFMNKQISTKEHDIDALIKKNTLKMQLGSNSLNGKSNKTQLKHYLRELNDPDIQNLLKVLQWGDPFTYPLLGVPFGLDQQRCQFHFNRSLSSAYNGEMKTYADLLNHVEAEINLFYVENPLKEFNDDDILTIYNLLGLPQDCDDDSIKKRFHILSHNFHPDKFQGQESEQRQANINHNYITIQKAYETLVKRKDK